MKKQGSDQCRRPKPRPKPNPSTETANRRLVHDRRLTQLVKRIDAHVLPD